MREILSAPRRDDVLKESDEPPEVWGAISKDRSEYIEQEVLDGIWYGVDVGSDFVRESEKKER